MKEDQETAPVPLRTILQNFLNHVENLDTIADDSYDKEFQSLKLFSENLKGVKQYACSEGEKEVNRKKNRYKDILPFDYTRVILSPVTGVQGSDYVNANFIKGASGSLAYIACQGPLPHTANDFWRMVVECEVQVIVMACNEEESGKHKCEHYWVDYEGEERQFGMATIRLLKASVVCPDFLVRTMQLKYQKDGTSVERTVCQFHYSAWPDHGVPPLVRPLLDMVRLVRDTQASETLPVLVHCSAGCGRTGTICAIDYVWGLLRAGKLTPDFSLLKLVRDMRKQRIAMVQTKDQYILVHKAVRELFQEQLKMIDAHPYENVDLNGVPLLKEDHTYEQVNTQPLNDEKQDSVEKERMAGISNVSTTDKGITTPPLPFKKKRAHTAASKQEKEVENQSQKDLANATLWPSSSQEDNFGVQMEPLYAELSASAAYTSAVDSGLSTSSTDSFSNLPLESLPKRCPVSLAPADLLVSGDPSSMSSPKPTASTNSPSISSLLQKPRIAKLKALFERSSSSKPTKNSGKPSDETEETPKSKRSQQVIRSHSLGAIRKPHKFSQFHTASETPVALYKKLFLTKDEKDGSVKKKMPTPALQDTKESVSNSSSSSSISTAPLAEGKATKKVPPKEVLATKIPPSCKVQNTYLPPPRAERPTLPIKRSKSLKVMSCVDRSHFSSSENYAVSSAQQQALPGNKSDLQVEPPRELSARSVICKPSSSNSSSSSHNYSAAQETQACSKAQAARLASNCQSKEVLPVNGSLHFRDPTLYSNQSTRAPYPVPNGYADSCGAKLYVNLAELRHSESIPKPPLAAPNLSEAESCGVRTQKTLDDDTQRVIDDCRIYLEETREAPPLPQSLVQVAELVKDDNSSEQFNCLSMEAQRKIHHTMVGGIGIRERRSSFRKAVCHEGGGKSNARGIKDYEPIWLQSKVEGRLEPQVESSETQRLSNGLARPERSVAPFLPYPDTRMETNGTLSSTSSGSSGGGKRPEHNYALLSWDAAQKMKVPIESSPHRHIQQEHLRPQQVQQQILPKPMAANISNSRMPPNCSPATPRDPTSWKDGNNLESYYANQQQQPSPQRFVPTATNAMVPLAPPRAKKMHPGQALSKRPVSQDFSRHLETGQRDPMYANALQQAKDSWHGAPGVDLDAVAASIKGNASYTDISMAANSTSLTRAFEKLRTKMSPKNESDATASSSPPSLNARQQGTPLTKAEKPLPAPYSSPTKQKQQQYL